MSGIARLRVQIELECQAAKQGLQGLAIVGSHDSINARMERLWDYRQELNASLLNLRNHHLGASLSSGPEPEELMLIPQLFAGSI